MIELTPAERRRLRAAAHALSPVVSIAARGLTEAVLSEIERALAAHQLIKVRVYGQEREQRAGLLVTIAERLGCAPVQHIGNVLVFWRPPTPEPSRPAPSPARRQRQTLSVPRDDQRTRPAQVRRPRRPKGHA